MSRPTLNDIAQLCLKLESDAKALADWAQWGARATETQPGAREVYAPGCLDAEVLQQRGLDLLASAQAIVQATTVQPDPAEVETRAMLDTIPVGAELEDDAENFGVEVKHWYVGFYEGQAPESIEAAYAQVLTMFSDASRDGWKILSPAVTAIEYDLAAYPNEDWGNQFPSVAGDTEQEKVVALFTDREKWFCTEMHHEVLGSVFAFYGDWSGAEGFYWVPSRGLVHEYSPN